MSCNDQRARPDREAACRECHRDTKHRVIAQHDATEVVDDVGTWWTHHALVECRGCGTISYEYSSESTEDMDFDGSLVTTRRSYPSAEKDELPEGVVVLLMTDIVDSTALTEQLGDAGFRAKADPLHKEIVDVIRFYDGKRAEGNVLGDGILGVFTSTAQGLKAAISCLSVAKKNGLRLHIGLNAGDVQRDGQTVQGGAVNTVARVTGKSAPNEILVTEAVRAMARTSTSLKFIGRGTQKLKGIIEPLALYTPRKDKAWREIVKIESW